MHVLGNELEQILAIVPDWRVAAEEISRNGTIDNTVAADLGKGTATIFALLQSQGARPLYEVLSRAKEQRSVLLRLVRDHYLLVLASRMCKANGTARRYYSQKHTEHDEQQSQLTSLAVEVSLKLDATLLKNLEAADSNGFKVLLPAYIQTSVNNAVLDYIKHESQWERQTASGAVDEDGNEYNPVEQAMDDPKKAPDQVILSREKVAYLNQLKEQLERLYASPKADQAALTVIDCLFGLGLSKHSTAGKELTLRECCEVLKIEGDTQARKIARCQVLMDKGMKQLRQFLRDQLPDLVELWQKELNVNVASRRELDQRLSLTEGEVERLIVNRQYIALEQLVERLVVKVERLESLRKRGAVAAFVPIDMNAVTARDLTDVLGLSKAMAQKIVDGRPFASLQELVEQKLLPESELSKLQQRGAVLRSAAKIDLNRASLSAMVAGGVPLAVAESLERAAPFESWAHLDDFIGNDEVTWAVLRKNFSLGKFPP
ncbi:MAG TPA: helix-hairpin-helix domain-containing protein [Chroococcales cyanobacterium]